MASKEQTEIKQDVKRKRTIKKETVSAGGDSKRIKSEPATKDASGRSLFYAEDEEVDTREPKKDLEIFKNTCDDIRKSMEDIRRLKNTKHSTEEIESKRVDATLQFVILKKLSRLAHIRCKKVREATNEAKQRIDQYHLQLQNLLYEVMHLEKEITKCLEFKSKDEEIELVSVEDFYKDAPTQISKPAITKTDNHQLTLSRLDWELEQRIQLDQKLVESKGNKEQLEEEIKTKEEYLENLQPKLSAILQSTKPVQEYLDMPFDQIREQHQTACHLPEPLYVLYMQSSAYKNACDKYLDVKIEGEIQAAKALASASSVLADEDSDSDQEEQEKQKSKRRRKTTDVRSSDRKQKVLKKHPLSVVLEIKCKDGSSLHLTFNYLLVLNIITVNIQLKPSSDATTSSISGGDLLAPNLLMNQIYPGDHGNTSPNSANQYELSRLGLRDFSSYLDETGRPFLWAQWLAGLQFLGSECPQKAQNAISSAHMQKTIKKLRGRIKSRLSLLKQLSSLERGSILVHSEYQSMFPAKIIARLVSWKRSTFEDFSVLPHAKNLTDQELVEESDIFFTCVMERGSAKLTAQIVLGPNYPEVAPVFVISIQWQTERTAMNDFHIQEMEEEVNVHYKELVREKSQDQILTNQLQRLLMCFDVYLETETQCTESEGPIEISKEKVFARTSRGPNRTKPYRYSPDIGIFTHR